MKYWHVPCYRWLRRCEVYWLSVPFVVLSKVWPTRGYFTTCSYRHFRSVLDLTEVQPEKLRVRGNPRKGIISVRILRPRSEIRKYETKQNHVRKLRNDSSKWYDWNLKGIRILAFSVRNLRKYEAYLALWDWLVILTTISLWGFWVCDLTLRNSITGVYSRCRHLTEEFFTMWSILRRLSYFLWYPLQITFLKVWNIDTVINKTN